MKNPIFIIACLLLCSCASTPYWSVYRNDGIEKRRYLKAGWPSDHKCKAYASNNPIKHSTHAKLHFYKPAKR